MRGGPAVKCNKCSVVGRVNNNLLSDARSQQHWLQLLAYRSIDSAIDSADVVVVVYFITLNDGIREPQGVCLRRVDCSCRRTQLHVHGRPVECLTLLVSLSTQPSDKSQLSVRILYKSHGSNNGSVTMFLWWLILSHGSTMVARNTLDEPLWHTVIVLASLCAQLFRFHGDIQVQNIYIGAMAIVHCLGDNYLPTFNGSSSSCLMNIVTMTGR